MKPKVGLLPLYLQLYDDTMPELRGEFLPFLDRIVSRLSLQQLDVELAEICRTRAEVAFALQRFEGTGVDVIATVHLAYSPSLESADLLTNTALPVVLLDTTMDYEFPQTGDPQRLMFNHGIHGVQDLASVLRRKGKAYEVFAGHVDMLELYERVGGFARAAFAAQRLKNTKALRIGETFAGMGDFAVDSSVLRSVLGISVNQIGVEPLIDAVSEISPDAIQTEIELDRERYCVTAPQDVHERSVRVGLGLRNLLEREGYTAFSANFLAFNTSDGPVDTVPFLEASKAMARGIGYAGEGDVLTAALVGALQTAFGLTTFTEIFCPDWKRDQLFISHMGEVNPDVAAAQPKLCEKAFPWTGARNPAILTCAPQQGPAVLVSLAPGPMNTFRLVLAQVDVMPDTPDTAFGDWVRGWIEPTISLSKFLERYSLAGGTHHCALLLGDQLRSLMAFARLANLDCTVIEPTVNLEYVDGWPRMGGEY